jgi:hypothetical protein
MMTKDLIDGDPICTVDQLCHDEVGISAPLLDQTLNDSGSDESVYSR